MARLICVEGMKPGLTLRIKPGEASLGRGVLNDLVVMHDSVSRKHATFKVDDEQTMLRDLESKNGTFVNGRRITSIHLKNGDQVRFGEVTFTFEDDKAQFIAPVPEEKFLQQYGNIHQPTGGLPTSVGGQGPSGLPSSAFETAMGENQADHSIFVDYFKIIRRRKWLILLCMFGVLIPVAVWTYLTLPVYQAEGLIIYEEPQDTMFALDIGQPFYNKSAIVNLTEQMKSRALALEVARALPDCVLQAFKFPKPMPPGFSKHRSVSRQIREGLTVSGVRGSDVLNIRVQANAPVAAQIVLNTYIERVIAWNLQKKRLETTSVRQFVEDQLAVSQDKLATAEETLQRFKERNNLISLSEAATEILARLTEAEVAYNQAKTEREALEHRHRYIEQKKQELMPTLTVVNNSDAQELKEELIRLEMQVSANQLKGMTEKQPEIIALRQQINRIKQDLIQQLLGPTLRENLIDPLSQLRNLLQESISLEVELETFKAREQSLKNTVDEYNQKLQQLPRHELELARLIRDKEVNDRIYSMLLEKREEARITEASKVGDVRVIDFAELPFAPIKPQKAKNFALGIILGLSLGIGLAFFLESLDTSMKSQEDIEKRLFLPVLASIPSMNLNGVTQTFRKHRHKKELYAHKLLNQLVDTPHVFEAYRALLFNFDFVNADKKLKLLLVTSAGAGEGKTLTTINMAQLFARNGLRCLLIDCDLRRPMVHKVLDMYQEPGLTNVLVNKATLEQAIQPVPDSDLHVLTSGMLPPNPSELLNSQRMHGLLNEVRQQYQMVLLDSPPVIAVTDALILGIRMDGVCLVLRAGKTDRDAALRTKKLLQNSGIRLIGVVLNDVDLKATYGYYKDYYYYSNKHKPKKVTA
ncbi:polysaccharide biosynthesis tyrosine autokinase [candidate division KSB1 bacterium]|nr:polysaccharide biosynthesis tyrosine autokinase [candidate division KSB1 bacterium]